jgi:hypothetical protein
MDANSEWYFIFIFFGGIIGLLVSCILYFLNHNKSLGPRLLAIYLCLFSLISIHIGLSYTNFFL